MLPKPDSLNYVGMTERVSGRKGKLQRGRRLVERWVGEAVEASMPGEVVYTFPHPSAILSPTPTSILNECPTALIPHIPSSDLKHVNRLDILF